jgi:protocatechuate 3,4-dioxygenase beta subunit
MDSKVKAAVVSLGLIIVLVVGYMIFFADPATQVVEGPGDDSGATPVVDEAPTKLPAAVADAVAVQVQITAKDDGSELTAARLSVTRRGQTVRRSEGAVHDFHLEPRDYEFSVSCHGFANKSLEVSLLKGDAAKTVTFELDRGLSISGRVLGTDGLPIGGADVAAFRALADPNADLEETLRAIVDIEKIAREEVHTTVSEENGTYQIDGLEPRWYSVRAVADGHAPGEREDVPAPSKEIDIILDVGATLEGFVHDTSGDPIAGAAVMAKIESEDPQGEGVFSVVLKKGRPPVETATTDAAGRFRLNRLGAGLYNFKVAATGYWEHVEMAVRLESGTNPSKTFSLEAGRVIKGILQNPEEEPIVGAEVQLVPFHGHERNKRFDLVFREPVKTDKEGRFLFHSLEDIRHLITFYHKDYRTEANKKALPSDEDQIFVMKRGPRLEGRILAADTEEPIVGAIVSVDDPGSRVRTGTSGEDGSYVVSGLTKRKRRLIAYVDAKGYGRIEREFNARAGDTSFEDFNLLPAGVVSGRVVAGGEPASHARVEVRRAEEGPSKDRVRRTEYTDSDGEFKIDDLDPGVPMLLRVKLRTFIDSYSEPFELESGEHLELEALHLVRGGELAGRVVNSSGETVENCTAEARPEGATDVDTEGTIKGKVSADGRYLLQGLKSGPIDLVVKAPGYVTFVRPVEARTDLRNQQDDVVLEPANVIFGRVVDPDGKGIGGARVTAWEFLEGVKEHRMLTLPNGEFRLDGLASKDTVEFGVAHSDYGGFAQDELAVNNEEPLVIELARRGVLRGFVIGADDGSVPDFVIQLKTRQSAGKPVKKQRYKDGRFELRGIPEGTYDIHFMAPKYDAFIQRDVRISMHDVVEFGTVKLPSR